MLGKDEIESRFGFHKATIEGPDATAEKHAMLRRHFKAFANTLDDLIDDSREKALMWTDLEEASMWSHKAIAKNAPILVEIEVVTPTVEEIKAKATGVLLKYLYENTSPTDIGLNRITVDRVTIGVGTDHPDSWMVTFTVDIQIDRFYIVHYAGAGYECEVLVCNRKPVGRRGPVFTD
jgi:hypothetical protein